MIIQSCPRKLIVKIKKIDKTHEITTRVQNKTHYSILDQIPYTYTRVILPLVAQ